MKKLIKLCAPACTAVLIFITMTLSSCTTMGGLLTNLATEIAVTEGVISRDTATRVQSAVEKSETASQGFTVEQEYSIGRGVASSILASYPLYQKEELTLYVNLVLQSLVANSETLEMINGYHAAVLDTNEINAFATSGGHILITKGLLKCAQSEDELACILAHELAHIQLQHNINAITAERKKDAGKAWGEALVSVAADNVDAMKELQKDFETVINTGAVLFESGYPQSQEFAADKKALEYAAAAGYNVKAMESVLDMLDKNTKPGQTGFGKNHPTPTSRLKSLKDQYNLYPSFNTEKVRTDRFNQAIKSL